MDTSVLRKRKVRNNGGFSLIELLVVMLIIGILLTVAIPSYSSYIRKTYRTQAVLELMRLQLAMERYYIQKLDFSNFEDDTGYDLSPELLEGRYLLSITNISNRSYVLKAVRQEIQSKDNCGTLTLNQLGEKGIEDATSGYYVKDCW